MIKTGGGWGKNPKKSYTSAQLSATLRNGASAGFIEKPFVCVKKSFRKIIEIFFSSDCRPGGQDADAIRYHPSIARPPAPPLPLFAIPVIRAGKCALIIIIIIIIIENDIIIIIIIITPLFCRGTPVTHARLSFGSPCSPDRTCTPTRASPPPGVLIM